MDDPGSFTAGPMVIGLTGARVVSARIAIKGQPNKMTFDRDQGYLYAAEDNSDSIGAIDTDNNNLVENIDVAAPEGLLPSWFADLKGNDTNSVAHRWGKNQRR